MATSARRRYRTALLIMLVLVAAIWGSILALANCETETVAASASPTPTASPSASPSPAPTQTPTASPTASPSPSASPTTATREVCKRPLKPHLGLDLQGGISVVLTAKGNPKASTIDKAVDIIRQRVDALGVAEADVARQGNNVLVQIPGITEQAKALKLIGTTAQMRFRAVLEEYTANSEAWTTATPPDCANPDSWPEDDPAKEVVLCARVRGANNTDLPPTAWNKLRMGPAVMTGSDVSGADAQLVAQSGQWQVDLRLTGEGGKKFTDITGKLACNPQGDAKRQLAIVLDRVVESHPQMGEGVECNRGISGGSAQITGSFSESEAKDLALVLRYGALPVAFEPSTTTTVSPTLGREALNGGLIAALIGLAVVFVYVAFFYRFLGLLVWVGILFHAAFTMGVVIILGKIAGFALTLAGIAGLIVSFGIAADSFIVYFERLKDEIVAGKTVRASVDRAWQSAWRTIVAADIVTALAAFVLYLLAVGSVRGFALMLGLSTALDLFVSYLFMHPSVWLLAQTKIFNESRTLGIGKVVRHTPAVSGGAR
jgi:protein-export membrane protein SecD